MLRRLEVMTLNQCMNQVAEGVNLKDGAKIKNGVHMLKGATGYVGAGRLHYICYQIQNAFHNDDLQKMLDYYPLLVESCIEFKRFSRKYLASLKSNYPSLFVIIHFIL